MLLTPQDGFGHGGRPGKLVDKGATTCRTTRATALKLALDLLGDDGLLDPTAQDEVVHLPNANRSWVAQYMYSLGIAVAGGTANIQRNVIGERGLGLPRDYYADRSSGK